MDGDATFEGIRTYFKRSSAGISGWISYHYDGSQPNIRITDEDDDCPYVSFRTIGSGTYDAPQYEASIGGRGPAAGRTTGLSFWNGNVSSGTEIMAVDSNFLRLPTYTTGNRPASPVAGMLGFNSTINRLEAYMTNVWASSGGTLVKSTTQSTITSTGGGTIMRYTLPGGTLGTDGILRIRAGGYWQNSSGSTRTITLAISYGGTTLWQDVSATIPAGITDGWEMNLSLVANNSANAQAISGFISIGDTTGAPTTGLTGNLGSDEMVANAVLYGTSAVNSANNNNIVLSVVAISGTGTTFLTQYYYVELL